MTQPLSPDDLMAFEQAGAADYRKARSVGLPIVSSLAAALTIFRGGFCRSLHVVEHRQPVPRLRGLAVAHLPSDPEIAALLAKAVGAKFAMAELGDVLE